MGKFRFWLYGRKQKEEAMHRMQTGRGAVIHVGYVPKNASHMSRENTKKGQFKRWWKTNRKEIWGATIQWNLNNIRQAIKEYYDEA